MIDVSVEAATWTIASITVEVNRSRQVPKVSTRIAEYSVESAKVALVVLRILVEVDAAGDVDVTHVENCIRF